MPNQPGMYSVKVKSQGFARGESGKKSAYFFLEFVIQGQVVNINGEEKLAAVNANPAGGDVKFYLSEGAVEWSVEKLKKLGWEGCNFADLDPDGGAFTCSLVGEDIDLVNTPREWEGKMYDNWEMAGEGSKLKNSTEVRRELDSLFGNVLRRSAGAAPAKKETTPAPVEPATYQGYRASRPAAEAPAHEPVGESTPF